MWIAWLYSILSAVAPVWRRSPALFSCLHSVRHDLNFSFIVLTTVIQIKFNSNLCSIWLNLQILHSIQFLLPNFYIILLHDDHLPSFTVAVGCSLPALSSWVARFRPELSHWRARTSRMTCSARFLVAALPACSMLPSGAGCSILPRGPALERATSHTQSHNATTKFSFARISLCSRSISVSSGSSGAINVNGRSSAVVSGMSGNRLWKLPVSKITRSRWNNVSADMRFRQK